MQIKRVAAIGDVHAEDELLEKAIHFCREQVDLLMTVGDIVDGAGDVNRCCDLLRENNVATVKGNHERWMLNNEMRVLADATHIAHVSPHHLDWLKALPAVLEFDCTGGKLLLCHGLGENDMKTLLPDETGYALNSNEALEKVLYQSSYRYVIKGHSHRRMVRRLDKTTFINAGTLRNNNSPGFCIVDFAEQRLQFFDFVDRKIKPLDAVPLP